MVWLMGLRLTAEQIQVMKAHGEQVYPQECCGLLLGTLETQEASSDRVLHEVRATQNSWEPELDSFAVDLQAPVSDGGQNQLQRLTRDRRYWIDPKDLLQAQREARDRNLNIIGIYHSHPDHPAIPSECDRAQAWPEYSYIIMSVQQGKTTDVKSWTLDSQHQFEAEELVIV